MVDNIFIYFLHLEPYLYFFKCSLHSYKQAVLTCATFCAAANYSCFYLFAASMHLLLLLLLLLLF